MTTETGGTPLIVGTALGAGSAGGGLTWAGVAVGGAESAEAAAPADGPPPEPQAARPKATTTHHTVCLSMKAPTKHLSLQGAQSPARARHATPPNTRAMASVPRALRVFAPLAALQRIGRPFTER